MRRITITFSRSFSSFSQLAHQVFDNALASIEHTYKKALSGEQVSFSDGFSASRNIVLAHLCAPEYWVTIVGMLALVHTSGSVLAFEDASVFCTVIVTVVGVLVPVFISLIFFPFHIILNIRYSTVTFTTAVLSAYILSAVYTFPIGSYAAIEFGKTILPLLLIYGISALILTMRLSSVVSFSSYERKYSNGEIASILPLSKRGNLISISAQDHYVEIVTNAGSHLNRMSMKEAIEIVPESMGIQTHRSHWVAYSAMGLIEKSGERVFLVLRNGTRIPVSKPKLPQVQAYLDSRQESTHKKI